MNRLDCWWISMNFEQKKEIFCRSHDECLICPMFELCEKYDQHEDIPEKDLEIEEVFNGKDTTDPE